MSEFKEGTFLVIGYLTLDRSVSPVRCPVCCEGTPGCRDGDMRLYKAEDGSTWRICDQVDCGFCYPGKWPEDKNVRKLARQRREHLKTLITV